MLHPCQKLALISLFIIPIESTLPFWLIVYKRPNIHTITKVFKTRAMFIVVLKLALVESSLTVDHQGKSLNQVVNHSTNEKYTISHFHHTMLIIKCPDGRTGPLPQNTAPLFFVSASIEPP